jgi:hypothetical protein
LLLLETVSIAFLQEEGKEPALGVFFLSAGSTNAINVLGKKTESKKMERKRGQMNLLIPMLVVI